MASSSATIYGFEGELQDQKNRLSSSSDPLPAAAAPPATAPTKRKRNQPGRPNPDAEVIALSPKTLMATNRFICEVCNKGFQREQNLRLHRRGHNLPWSLRQKVAGEVKQRVYICPEPTCVHHDPSRALGDLTGIKKHFFRKHGEKKWKCEKCSKHYAVLSDLKAHSKTCGTREYRCGCGTVFSRRDSFITHRAFCDALAQESSHISANLNGFKGEIFGRNNSMNFGLSQMPHQISGDPSAEKSFAGDLLRFGNQPGSSSSHLKGLQFPHSILPEKTYHGMTQFPEPQFIPTTSSSSSSAAAASSVTSQYNLNFFSQNRTQTDPPSPPFKLMQPSGFTLPQISENGLFPSTDQMGATASGSRTLFRGIESTYPSGNVHDAHLRDLMNSLAHGNVAVDLMGCSEEHEEFKQVCVGEEGGLLRGKEPKLQRGLQMNGIGGTAGFTRDFLGIGSMVRTMISERDQNTDVDFLPFESELASASSGRDFSGRGWP